MSALFQDGIEEYALAHSSSEPDYLRRIHERTERDFPGRMSMLTGHLQGRFLKLLVAMTGARRVVEVGCFTGYASLAMAEALPPDGELVTLDIDPAHISIAREHFASATHGERIRLVEGPAIESLRAMEGPVDLVFIDADKENYTAYYEESLRLLRSGGIIAVDNVLWYGRILDPSVQDPDTVAIRAFNEMVAADPRVEAVMLTVRDGVTLARKLP